MSTYVEFECDRCGETTEALKEGWGTFSSGAKQLHLCEGCTHAFLEWADLDNEVSEGDESEDFEEGETVNDPSLTRKADFGFDEPRKLDVSEMLMPLSIPETRCAVGEIAVIQIAPQRGFDIERVVISSMMAREGYYIESIDFPGEVPLTLPIEVFSEVAIGVRSKWPVEANERVIVRIGRREYEPAPFTGVFLGRLRK